MNFKNPIISGFYPDPSVCYAEGYFYLVNSTFQYFPGIPLFRSSNMIDWEQIGHVLTRKSQLNLTEAKASQGLFAPTIRYHGGRFYMIVTHVNDGGNFFVYTDDIMGEWSDPIYVPHQGIDPSLFFEGDKVYYTGTGQDENGVSGIFQCEIDILTGKLITKSRCITYGSGGRYVEGPHLYHIGEYYYLLIAEGGTEYGHMITFFRSKDPYGPFESCPNNPILTNRNLGGYYIQGAGHGDLIQDKEGKWWMVHLAFRQTGKWRQFHHLGRETFLVPVEWTKDGWIKAGVDGTCRSGYTYSMGQWSIDEQSMDETERPEQNWKLNEVEMCFLRNPIIENYKVESEGKFSLKGSKDSLNEMGTPTFLGMRQKENKCNISYRIQADKMYLGQEAGFTVYMDEDHHYDLKICKESPGYLASLAITVGGKTLKEKEIQFKHSSISVRVRSDSDYYYFYVENELGEEVSLGEVKTKYVSSEVAEGFTGVIIAGYCIANRDGESGWIGFEPL